MSVRISLIRAVLAGMLLAGCSGGDGSDTAYYEYRVSGEVCGARIEYIDRAGETRTSDVEVLPWATLFTLADESLQELSLSATNTCDWGVLTVKITASDGRAASRSCEEPPTCTASATLVLYDR